MSSKKHPEDRVYTYQGVLKAAEEIMRNPRCDGGIIRAKRFYVNEPVQSNDHTLVERLTPIAREYGFSVYHGSSQDIYGSIWIFNERD